jgi:hypothetical protein
MSDRLSDSGDWSSQSEALFRSARGDHAPTANDRARVRSALAQRLAAASNIATAGSAAPSEGVHEHASRAALGKLLKIGAGVACVMAGTFAWMHEHESSRPAVRTPAAVQPTAAGAKPEQPTPAPTPSTQDAATTTHDEPVVVSHSDGTPTARVVAKRTRTRSTAARLSAAPRTPAQPEPKGTAADGAGLETQALTSDSSAAASSSAVARATLSEPEPAPRAAAQPAPARVATAEPADAADERAELAFVARINTALLGSKLRTVLTLCTEHERRWPHGAFVQEREGLRAIASCGSGAMGAAAHARTFLASYPRAPLASRVREACARQLTAAVQEHPGQAEEK